MNGSKLIRRYCTSTVCFLVFVGSIATAADYPTAAQTPRTLADQQKEIDQDVSVAMKQLHVPGVAVGVILNDKVVLAKGYGLREIDRPQRVDVDTLFDIGSMTKSFTAAVVATEVDKGELNWDTPVINYLPWFRLYDPVATELITPRDLLTHRSGLPRHDFIRESTYLSREELVHRLRYLEPSHTFRETYQYNNLMYVVAGYLAGVTAQSSWEALVRERIFEPLGMTHSDTSAVEIQQAADFARPHVLSGGHVSVIPFYDYQKFGVGPNGAINSCVDDMLKYLQFHLGTGMVGEKRVISQSQMEQLHKPVTVIGSNGATYALGWVATYHRGHEVLEHGGVVPGFSSYMILLPEKHLGVVVLSNLQSDLPQAIGDDLLDRAIGLTPLDYLKDDIKATAEYESRLAEENAELESTRIRGTKPTLSLTAYAGTYVNPAYGSIHVTQDGDSLTVHFDALELRLAHFHYDTFSYVFGSTMSLAQFRISRTGAVQELLLPLEPAVHPLVFVKQAGT